MSQLGHALTTLNDPPVKALVVYNSNPAAIAPDQNAVRRGLRRDDLFTVVLEQIPDRHGRFRRYRSARHHIPRTHRSLLSPTATTTCNSPAPLCRRPAKRCPNQEIFRRLAARMGFNEPCFADTDDDMIRAALESDHPFIAGITLEHLDAESLRSPEHRRPVPALRRRRLRHALRQMRISRRNARL